MADPTYRMRMGTIQGVRHWQLGVNNQDACLIDSFTIRKTNRSYRVGLVSDGCSGVPAFTHNEIGANLLVVHSWHCVQNLILNAVRLQDIPVALYASLTTMLR